MWLINILVIWKKLLLTTIFCMKRSLLAYPVNYNFFFNFEKKNLWNGFETCKMSCNLWNRAPCLDFNTFSRHDSELWVTCLVAYAMYCFGRQDYKLFCEQCWAKWTTSAFAKCLCIGLSQERWSEIGKSAQWFKTISGNHIFFFKFPTKDFDCCCVTEERYLWLNENLCPNPIRRNPALYLISYELLTMHH